MFWKRYNWNGNKIWNHAWIFPQKWMYLLASRQNMQFGRGQRRDQIHWQATRHVHVFSMNTFFFTEVFFSNDSEMLFYQERITRFSPLLHDMNSDAVLCVVSELARSQQDLQGAGGGRERDPPAPPQVLLLGSERRLQRPGAAQSALRAGHMHDWLFFFCLFVFKLSTIDIAVHSEDAWNYVGNNKLVKPQLLYLN